MYYKPIIPMYLNYYIHYNLLRIIIIQHKYLINILITL